MRPLVLRILPSRLRQSIASRFYFGQYDKWLKLYKETPLALCPLVSMYNLIPGDIISGNIVFNGFYELALSNEIIKLGQKGGLLVDVGSNMGYFSLLWAGINPSNTAIAFEAAPRNIKLILNNINMNNLTDRVKLIPKAVGQHEGQVSFDLGLTEQTGWGGITAEPTDDSIVVPIIRLDNKLSGSFIDVLKIDIEGADTWVLYGCEALLRRKRIRNIYFEQNKQRMDKLGIAPDDAKTFLGDLGYTCKPFSSDDREWVAYPT